MLRLLESYDARLGYICRRRGISVITKHEAVAGTGTFAHCSNEGQRVVA